MIPDTGPRWYETPLWFVAQVPVYVVVAWGLDRVLPYDLGSAGRVFVSTSALLITFGVAVAVRRRLRRPDA